MSKTGSLITNLGTPKSPDVKDVRSYLKEFLMDPYVLDVPGPIRSMIVNGFILPFRPKKSAAAYASIWNAQGSPLLVYSCALREKLAAELPGPVALGMRYGDPSIPDAIAELVSLGVSHIVAIPLYPQYADSTVTTSIDVVRECLPSHVTAEFITAFYDDPEYIEALGTSVKAALPERWDHLLMSYHGLPERHMKKADPTGSHCMQQKNCCAETSPAHATCYRHQVFATSTALANYLNLDENQYSVSFQSRLGTGWLQPFTDKVLAKLPTQGIKHLAVVCPAFVADNLETVEEMGLRGREIFLAAGGESFHLVPCLNDEDAWAKALARMLTRRADGAQTETAAAETSL